MYNLETIYQYQYLEKADLGKHCLLQHKPGFPRLRHNDIFIIRLDEEMVG